MKIFIAGPRAISTLASDVKERLHSIYSKNYTVLVGDANGADKAVQKYFAGLNYANVIVYASSGKTRNNLGNWLVEAVPVTVGIKGFEFFAAKDKAMAKAADYGFMLWNGESKGTLNNIINLLRDNKKALVHLSLKTGKTGTCPPFNNIDSFEKLESLLKICPYETWALYKSLTPHTQLTLQSFVPPTKEA